MALNISKKFLFKIILDQCALLFVGLFLLFLYLWVEPFQRGFYCNDMSIRYPFKDNTINEYALAALVLIPIIIGITSVELYRYKNKTYSQKVYKTLSRELYDKFIPFLFGCLASLLCTLISKAAVGRLRPYFYNVCQPSVQCDASNAFMYIDQFECKGVGVSPQMALDEMRMSFMSGHSSLMAFSMVYLTIYLQKRWPISKTSNQMLIRALVQTLALNLAFYVGYTRISDYWHHWSDVLVGLIQGTLSAIITVKYISDLIDGNTALFESLIKRDKDIESNANKNKTDFQIRLIKQSSI